MVCGGGWEKIFRCRKINKKCGFFLVLGGFLVNNKRGVVGLNWV